MWTLSHGPVACEQALMHCGRSNCEAARNELAYQALYRLALLSSLSLMASLLPQHMRARRFQVPSVGELKKAVAHLWFDTPQHFSSGHSIFYLQPRPPPRPLHMDGNLWHRACWNTFLKVAYKI